MKTTLSIICSVLFSLTVFSQQKGGEEDKMPKKIETIKIIDGDTVFHDVRTANSDDVNRRYRRAEYYSNVEMDEEMDALLKDLDIYIQIDDNKKRKIVNHLIMEDAELEGIIEQLEKDEDLVLDMKDGRENVRVIKIEIDDKNGEEVKIVRMEKGPHHQACKENEGRHGRQGRHGMNGRSGMKGSSDGPAQGLNVFPNPAKDELNMEFGVPKGSKTQVIISDLDGKQIFSKTYTEPGFQKETIRLEEQEEGIYIVTLKDSRRNITKKIIVE